MKLAGVVDKRRKCVNNCGHGWGVGERAGEHAGAGGGIDVQNCDECPCECRGGDDGAQGQCVVAQTSGFHGGEESRAGFQTDRVDKKRQSNHVNEGWDGNIRLNGG